MSEGEKIIGIDLGTTNSVVAVMEGKEVKVIPNQEGNRLTPSIIAFTDKAERLVGDPARRQAITNPRRTVYSIKRFMGRRHNEVQSEEKLVPYGVVGGPEELVKVKIDDKEYTPPEISAMVLRKLKESAEAYLGHKVKKAVITVPAYFNDSQRQATKDAGHIAGLEVMRIINEPTAASLAYGLDKKKNEKIAVFDLGGGTFDVSILDIAEGVFDVLATNGNTHLGGDDFDEVLVNYIADDFKNNHGIDLRKDAMALQRLKEAAERAKKDLSTQAQTDVNLPFITADASGPKHLTLTIQRNKFEQLVDHLIQQCKGPCEAALKDAKLKPSDIDEVVLVGGSTRIPKVKELVKTIFGKEPHEGVNPDEVVAIGAAIQGGVLAGDVQEVLLLDVTPLSLGIETLGGVMTKLIERNTTIPTDKKQTFSTAEDGQTAVDIHVLQGEREFARDNRTLGKFRLDGINPQPRGMPQVEVTFSIDANGILNVAAKDMGSQKEQKITIQSSSGLSKDDVEKMRRDADAHADEDKKRRELVDTRNEADSLVYQVEKQMKDLGDKLSDSDKEPLQAAIAKVNTAKAGEDVAVIKSAVNDLNQAMMAMMSAASQRGSGPTGAPGGFSSGPDTGPSQANEGAKKPADDTIDVEYKEKA